MKNKITTDNALIFSAIMIIVFTAIMIWLFYLYQIVPDALIVAFFACFGLEGGYCAFVYKIKKSAKDSVKAKRLGDITGFDDAEIIEDIPDDDELVIDLDDEEQEDG